MIFSAPTTSANVRTLVATYANWKHVTAQLDPTLARKINRHLTQQRTQPLIRIDFTPAEASAILKEANTKRS